MALAVGSGLAACSPSPSSPSTAANPGAAKAAQGPAEPEQAAGAVAISVSVPKGATDVRPDTTLSVRADGGSLTSVTVTPEKGKAVVGKLDGSQWTASTLLSPKTTYTVTATGQNDAGTGQTVTSTFTTLTPRVTATYRVLPDGDTVGVGLPAMVTFDSPVATPAQRAAVERRVSISTTPHQEGAWGWSSNSQLYWRPKTFWKPGTKVTVNAPLTGVQTGDGKWIGRDAGATFTVGRARISTVDLKRHRMTVTEDGKVVRTYPISGGQNTPRYVTRTGTKVITEKLARLTMDAATLGVPKDHPDYYKLEVDYAMRVTNTGEFLHSAPWSVWAQGRSNVSHGCINMGPRDAREMFRQSLVGDVVQFTGSNRPMRPGDGMDAWVYSWKNWRARSALSPAKA